MQIPVGWIYRSRGQLHDVILRMVEGAMDLVKQAANQGSPTGLVTERNEQK